MKVATAKIGEGSELESPRCPEDVCVAEGAEPEQIDPVGEGRLTTEHNYGDGDD